MSTPHQHRLEALKMAKDILFEDYYAKRQTIDQNFQIELDEARRHERKPGAHAGYPAVPSIMEIVIMAKSFNDFVSTDNRK